ncbi:hypothetical protein [Micromonospora sp. NBC_01796]|uniref:hypothetical protein n=1 Tax=Micromonospora sp. NBC_01796 TaxID=2975987 RepID=UPI002DD885B5|nr:hypothetical protein [Micromonospora sp. NBC_01796]WSA83286.1 hypothetical protein OIE47_23080 [Micromonospora sp. NBC_01796]
MRMQNLVELATSEPPPLRYTVDEIVESGQRGQRRRRLGWAASGATAVAVLGVVAAVTIPSLTGTASVETASPSGPNAGALSGTTQTVPVAAEPFTFTFGAYQVGKLRVAQPIIVSTAYQLAPVYADGLTTNDKASDPKQEPSRSPSLYAYLTVYRPGAYDPTKLAGARQVTIGDRRGLEVDGSEAGTRTLAWEYNTNAWAVIDARSSEADYPAAEDLRELAAGLRGSTPTEAKIPIKMAYVPSGYQLDEVGMHAMTGLNGIAGARDGDYAGLLFSDPALPTTGLTEPYGGVEGADPPGSFLVFVVPAANSNQQPSSGVTCLNGFCNRWAANGTVNLQVASGGRLSNTEMANILNGITLGNVQDDTTWTEVGAAIS